MGRRKVVLARGNFYHIFTKSIAGFEVFRSPHEYGRMLAATRFFQAVSPGMCFSKFMERGLPKRLQSVTSPRRVNILAYCLMPTHVHFFLEQKTGDGILEYMRSILNSYARYFNIKTHRNGPLWESRFKAVRVENDAQALHLTRYIHLNPTSAGLVQRPEQWEFSSYREYLEMPKIEPLCELNSVFRIQPESYRKFVDDRVGYQQTLQIIKNCVLD